MQASEAAAATASKSLLESLDDSDDDFGGPPPLLSAAPAVSPSLQQDGMSDTAAWQAQLIAAEGLCRKVHEYRTVQPDAKLGLDAHPVGRHMDNRRRGSQKDLSIANAKPSANSMLLSARPLPAFRRLALLTAVQKLHSFCSILTHQ